MHDAVPDESDGRRVGERYDRPRNALSVDGAQLEARRAGVDDEDVAVQ
jgi:hypothetical protein